MSVLEGKILEVQDLSKMIETDCVIKEALRLYTPLPTLPKFSNKAFKFGGYTIPADVKVVTSPIQASLTSH